jgi:hypothetical protein
MPGMDAFLCIQAHTATESGVPLSRHAGRIRVNSVYILLHSCEVVKAIVTEPIFYDIEGRLQKCLI